MPATLHRLSFEKPIYELEEQIAAMESAAIRVRSSKTNCGVAARSSAI